RFASMVSRALRFLSGFYPSRFGLRLVFGYTFGWRRFVGEPPPFRAGDFSFWNLFRFPSEEVFVGGFGGMGFLLLFGLALVPLEEWRGLFQPSYLWRYEYALEFYHFPGEPAGFSPGLFPSARYA